MAFRLIVLVLAVSSILVLWFSDAQFDPRWAESVSLDLGNIVAYISGANESIEILDLSSIVEYGQMMTGVDSDIIMASSLGYSGLDSILLAEEIPLIVGSWTSTGEITSWINSDPIPDLILSEVYYDGTDEWIEITNIGEGNFEGNIILSWAKSTAVSLTNISLLSGESKIFGDALAQISWNSFIGKTGLALSMTDTAAIVIQLIVSGQIADDFTVDQYRVNKYNDKKTAFEKVAEVSTRVHSDRIAHAQSGYTINPGIYFTTGMITGNVSFPPE